MINHFSDLGLKVERLRFKREEPRLISLADIDIEHLIRRPRDARVMAVAASMADEGLQAPVEVTPKRGDRWSLTKGWVRLEAARFLRWDEIEAVVWRGSAAERAQRQIDDNLLQDGCTVLDRAVYLAAGKVAWERQEGVTLRGGARRGDQSAKLGTLKPYWERAVELYGFGRRSVFRSLAIGEEISARAVELLAATDWADNQSALEQISRFAPDQQAEIAGLITAAEPKTLAEALSMVGGAAPADPLKKAFSSLNGGWGRLGARDRRQWLEEIAADLPPGVRIVFEDGR